MWVDNNNQHFGERRKKPKDLGIKLANDSWFFAEEAEILEKKSIPFISFIKSASKLVWETNDDIIYQVIRTVRKLW